MTLRPLLVVAVALQGISALAQPASQPPPAGPVPEATATPKPPSPPSPPTQAAPALSPGAAPVTSPVPDAMPERFRRWGGTISVNIPHPIFLELEHRLDSRWSFALGAGGLTLKDLKVGDVPLTLGIGAIDVRGRWHPWGGAFFVGAILGVQAFSGQATQAIPITVNNQTIDINTTVKASINGGYLTPHLGWLWVFRSGFTMGVDFGIQLAARPKTTLDITTDNNIANIAIEIIQQTRAYQNLEQSVQDAGNRLGKLPLPYFTVLRLGWMF